MVSLSILLHWFEIVGLIIVAFRVMYTPIHIAPRRGGGFGCWERNHLSNEKRAPGCLGCIGDEMLPSHMGIIISHYNDPYFLQPVYHESFFLS